MTISREEYARRLNEPLVEIELTPKEIDLAVSLAREHGGRAVLAGWNDWLQKHPGGAPLAWFAAWFARYTAPEPEPTPDTATTTDPFVGVRERLHMPVASPVNPTQGVKEPVR